MTMTRHISAVRTVRIQRMALVAATALLAMSFSTPANALTMKVDFGVDDTNGVGNSPNDVQVGFFDWSDPANGSFSNFDYHAYGVTSSRTISGVNVTLTTGQSLYAHDIAITVTGP